jgi:signal transduction histidine kinase
LDTSYFSKVLPTPESETSPEAKNDSLSVKNGEPNGISEKVRYIYQQHYGWVIFTASVLLIVILVFIAYAIRQRYTRRRTLQEAEQEQNRRYLEGMESERTRLAKELHDGVSNQLLAIEMRLNDNHNHNADDNKKWEQTRRLLTESREQVRRVSHELMPPEFSYAHLGEVIENFMYELDGTNGIAFHFDSQMEEADYKAIPQTDALEIYRIVQEAVTNAVKHAAPTDVFVLIKDEGNTVTIRITDNGTARQEGTHGIGLRTMSQRSDAIGATLTIERIPHASVVTLQYVQKK